MGKDGLGDDEIWDMGYGIWDMGYGIWDMGYGIWDMDGIVLLAGGSGR